jgi:hypothetical protein
MSVGETRQRAALSHGTSTIAALSISRAAAWKRQGFPLGNYAKLVDYTGRLFRQGKASISAELAGIFERMNCSTQSWQKRMERLGGDRLLGRFFASARAKLREIGERLGGRHRRNLTGCPLR